MGLHAGQAPSLTVEGSGGVYLLKDEYVWEMWQCLSLWMRSLCRLTIQEGSLDLIVGRALEGEQEVGKELSERWRHLSSIIQLGSKGQDKRGSRKEGERRVCRVPPTTLVRCYHEAFHYGADVHTLRKAKSGSLQQFVHAISSCEDMGSSLFSVDEVHKITVLDLRLANTDRNGGNILVCKEREKALKLVPIDHGYCLPEKFEDCSFEWLYWPQAQSLIHLLH
ncbi:hypothetical protein L7F22_041110 [Adiantum nelumboides]|nr:hypothetical protein [Adiantum nelumboides]